MRNLLVLVLLFCACGQGKEPDLAGEWVVSFQTSGFGGVAGGIFDGTLTLSGDNYDLSGDLVLGCAPEPCVLSGEFGMTAFGWDGWQGLFTAHLPAGLYSTIVVDGEYGADAFAGDFIWNSGGSTRPGSMYAYRE